MSNYGKQVILEMARFLRENPSATVSQLAEHMGWAENRSVYYWFNQTGYTGIKDFRKAALDRSLPFSERDLLKESPLKTYIPIVFEINSPSSFEYAERDFLCQIKTSAKAFAYLVPDKKWAPMVLPQDLLVIDPEILPAKQSLCLSWINNKGARLLRKITENCYAKDLYSANLLKETEFAFLGTVVLLQRSDFQNK